MLITATKNTPSYALAMLDIVFSCLEGVFVAGVFFTDPAITSFMSSTCAGWYEKYVEQYALVPKDGMNNNTTDMKLTPATSLTLTPSNSFQKVQSPSTATMFHQQSDNEFLDIYNINRLTDVQYFKEQKANEKFECDKIKTIAMRRLYFETAHHNKERQHQRMRQLSAINFDITATPPIAMIRHNDQQPHSTNTTTITTTTSSTVKAIYVPYQYPFFATCFRYILICFSHNNAKHNTFNNNTTIKHDYIDTLANDIPSSANSDTQSSTVIAITEENHQSKEQEQEIEFYTMLGYDNSSSVHKSMFDTDHI